MPRTLPTPRAWSQADVIRYLGRRRFELVRSEGWLKPRTIHKKGRGRPMETYAIDDVLNAESKLLGE